MGDALLDSALGDALLDSASSLIWNGDSKKNFAGSFGPVCEKTHAWRDVTSNFLGLATARQMLGTFCTAVLMSLIQG